MMRHCLFVQGCLVTMGKGIIYLSDNYSLLKDSWRANNCSCMHVEVCFSITLPSYSYCFLFQAKNLKKKKKLRIGYYNPCCMCLLNCAAACSICGHGGVAGAWWVEEAESGISYLAGAHQSEMCTGR